jgi:MFS family permease
MLIVARVLIGVGTSAGYPSAMLLIRRRATQAGLGAPPGGVLGGLVIAGMVTPAIGLPLGGVLVGAWSWRATFLVNIPLTLATLAMTVWWIPKDPARDKIRNGRDIAARLDVVGIAGFGGTMAALLVFLMSLPRPDYVVLGLAVIAGAALTWWELRASHPFFDVRLLVTNRALSLTYLRFAVLCLCLYTVLYGVTQWLQAGRGLTALAAGLVQLPMSLVSGVIARPVSRRNLLRAPLVIAAACCLAGSAVTVLFTHATSLGLIIVATLLFGVATGAGTSANQTALYTVVPAGQIGTASGLFRTFGYIGSIASSAILSITFHASVTDHGLHVIAVIMIAVSALAVGVTLADRQLMSLARAPTAEPD